MNNTTPTSYLIPDALQRRQLFYLIKQLSSYTAWKRIRYFYQQWADTVEASVREADSNGWGVKTSLPETDYVSVLKGLAHFDDGLAHLLRGDKRVFKYDVNGKFPMAERPISHFEEIVNRVEEGESGIDDAHTPLWAEFGRHVRQLSDAWCECSAVVLESQYLDSPARICFSPYWEKNLATLRFPQNLAEVPEPAERLVIATGGSIPCSGIWEPVDLPLVKKKTFSLFSSNKPSVPAGPLVTSGCMNYLHGGSDAPELKCATSDQKYFTNQVMWRLLWKDDRYENGIIPDEETQYVFTEPKENLRAPLQTSGQEGDLTWALSGTPAPVPGRWLVERDVTASITLALGETLPLHNGSEVRWVLAD